LQFDRLVAEVVEQPPARAEQYRRQVQPEFVDEAGGQVLLDDVGAAADSDVLVSGDRPGLRQGAVDAVGDEGERRRAVCLFSQAAAGRVVRPGDEPVQRHRDVGDQLSHDLFSPLMRGSCRE
jgi:hypothetical protein